MIEYDVPRETQAVESCCKRHIHNRKGGVLVCTEPHGHPGKHFACGVRGVAYVAWDSDEDEAKAAMIAALVAAS